MVKVLKQAALLQPWHGFLLWLTFLLCPSNAVAQLLIETDRATFAQAQGTPAQVSEYRNSCRQNDIFANEIEIAESSDLFQEELDSIQSRYEGRILSWEQQSNLFDEITLLYIQNNFITTRAVCSSQDFQNRKLIIHLIEGFIGDIIVEKDTGYDLSLISASSLDSLPEVGERLMVVAKIEDSYHIKVFDSSGLTIVDSASNALSSDIIFNRQLVQQIESALNSQSIDLRTENEIIRNIAAGIEEIQDINICPNGESGNIVYYESYIRDFIRRTTSKPLNIRELERSINALSRDPKFESVELLLTRGSQLGESIVEVKVSERRGCPYPNDPDSVKLSTTFNNYSSPSVGTYRVGMGLVMPGPFDLLNISDTQDELIVVAEVNPFDLASLEAARNINVGYRVPINDRAGSFLNFAYGDSQNKIIESSLEQFDLRANSEVLDIQYEQAIIQSPTQDLSLSLGLSIEDSQTFIFGDNPIRLSSGTDENGVSRASIVTFGQQYIRRGEGSQLLLNSRLGAGTGLFDATNNSDSLPDGQFLSWNLELQWLKRLSASNLLAVSGEAQFATDRLLPINQFSIGGGRSVRGYSQNILTGDNGFRLSIEDYIATGSDTSGRTNFFIIPFIDTGSVWNSSEDKSGLSSRQNFLLSVGLGLEWASSSGVKTRIDYGLPLTNVPSTGSSLQESGFTFQVEYELDLF